MTIHPLFSVPVFKGHLCPTEYQEAEFDDILNRMFLDCKLGDFTGETGLSTAPNGMNLHKIPELKWFWERIDYAVRDYWVNILGYRRMSYVECQHSWANKHFSNDSTAEHSHRDGWNGRCQVSGVYYFKKPKGSSNIHFCNPNDYILRMTPYEHMSGIDTISTEVTAEQYDFILFPSWVRHRVPPSNASQRIAISFNYLGYD